MEKLLTVAEVADLMQLSRQTVTRMFENEPGVLVIESARKMHKQRYRTIRIPPVVYERVLRKAAN